MANFAKQMKNWVGKAKSAERAVVIDSIISLSTTIVIRTPEGDDSLWKVPAPEGYEPGTLINNWFSSIGSPSNSPMRGQKIGGGDSISGIHAVAQLAPGKVFFLSNPTPYARRIEHDGWSQQAPMGMVGVTVVNWPDMVKAAAA